MEFTWYDENGELVGKIPSRLVELAKIKLKNKSSRNSLFKIYTIILRNFEKEVKRRKRKGKKMKIVYVTLSSSYFRKSINTAYKRYLDLLVENGFVSKKKRELSFQERRNRGIYIGLFDDPIEIETYCVGSQAKGYTVVEYPKITDVEVCFELKMKENPCSLKNKNFLRAIGETTPKISTDQYGYRIYHNLSSIYKDVIPKLNNQFVYYDLKSSIPYQIKDYLISKNHEDDQFLNLFNGDFYLNWGKELGITKFKRDRLKTNFNSFLYGDNSNYPPEITSKIKNKYPLLFQLRNKGIGRLMVKKESDLIQKQIVGKMKIDKVLTIHDAFIIYKKEQDYVDGFLSNLKAIDGFTIEKKSLR